VKDTAAAGDAVALRILEEAVGELANSVAAIVTRLKLGGDGEPFKSTQKLCVQLSFSC
jgi:N-acetylglucosamine kinase-like BadF-type ATPase